MAQTAFLNAACGEALRLRLPGHDQAGGIGDRGLQRLAGEEDDRRLHDGEDERKKRRRHETEFDGGRAILRAGETASDAGRNEPSRARLRDCLDDVSNMANT